jgi:hypothetical protein
VITLGPGSCKCPGQSQADQPWVYFLEFCITDANACAATAGTAFTVTQVVSNSGVNLVGGPDGNCGYPGLPASGTVGTGGCTGIVRLTSTNSANFLDITFNVGGGASQTVRVAAPPDCSSLGLATRCTTCD